MLLAKHLSWAFCGLLVCASTAQISYAQGGGGGGRGGFGGGQQTRARFELATLPEVQADLKLNDEQKKLATDQLAKQREKRASLMPAGGGGGGGGGGGAAMMTEMTKLNSDLDATFVGKLDDAQKSRMNGLIAQVNGASSLLDSDIAKAIEVTEEQAGKLKSAVEASRTARREAMQGVSQEDRPAAMAKLAESESKALLALLTEAQVKKFESLKGAALKFDLAPLRPARRAQ